MSPITVSSRLVAPLRQVLVRGPHEQVADPSVTLPAASGIAVLSYRSQHGEMQLMAHKLHSVQALPADCVHKSPFYWRGEFCSQPTGVPNSSSVSFFHCCLRNTRACSPRAMSRAFWSSTSDRPGTLQQHPANDSVGLQLWCSLAGLAAGSQYRADK